MRTSISTEDLDGHGREREVETARELPAGAVSVGAGPSGHQTKWEDSRTITRPPVNFSLP